MGHLHLPHLMNGGGGVKDVPKGCLAIKVGHEGEEKQRFVVPVVYFNHRLFLQLLKEAEEEYGFEHKGAITLPCYVHDFINIQVMIDKENHQTSFAQNHHHHHHHNHLHLVGCFKA